MELLPTEVSAPEYVPISAWLGHGHFAIWLVKQMKPAIIVELGTHLGFSYFCFCQAVREAALDTKCFAVDAWIGDWHAGYYGESVFQAVKKENQKYEQFSTLIRKNFIEAAAGFEDGTVDLLHVDGRHFYEDVSQDFEAWIPKLSKKAIVLFHDTEVKSNNFGVWKYWEEISRDRPSLNFRHEHGLGVLFWGEETSEALRFMLINETASFTGFFEQLGETFSATVKPLDLVDETTESLPVEKIADTPPVPQLPARQIPTAQRKRTSPLWRRVAFHRSGVPRGWLRLLVFKDEKRGKVRSFARRVVFKKNGAIRPEFDISPAHILPGTGPTRPYAFRAGRPLVVLLSGEPPERAGFRYRVADYGEAFRKLGFSIAVVPPGQISRNLEHISNATMLYIWRAGWSAALKEAIDVAKSSNALVIYDIDDLIFRPDMANESYMDALRFDSQDPARFAERSARLQWALVRSDVATATTAELAEQMRAVHPKVPVFVSPNGFTEEFYAKARAGLRAARLQRDDCLRIGYAAGSRTHQADFRICVGAVADFLRSNTKARLVLFSRDGKPMLDPVEFSELANVQEQIEWRRFVPHSELPFELARFDINLAPLELGNPFCDGKSELKFFEAAIADVPTIASPTGPLRRAIHHGKTGFLAASPSEWREALETLTNEDVRSRMGRAAHRSALWPFGPMNRVERVHLLLEQIAGGRRAARSRHFAAAHQAKRSMDIVFGTHLISFEHCALRPSRATVAMLLIQNEGALMDALESIRGQTIADLDLVLVDGGTQADLHETVTSWLEQNKDRFNRTVLIRHSDFVDSGAALNAAFDHSDTLPVLVVNPDLRLDPECCSRMLAAAGNAETAVSGRSINVDREAIALISKEAWALSGGFDAKWGIADIISDLERRGLLIDENTKEPK